MTLTSVLDDQVLKRYRELLDAEDEAFDELEHAYEDGDRDNFECHLANWQGALERKIGFLHSLGIEVPAPVSA
ncbi:MAG: hypothetical protein M1115_03540 [Actinobacteria bacterium]|nr:hypothetical protein [Actinomycetota bacterium]